MSPQDDSPTPQSELLLYRDANAHTRIEVRLEGDTPLWVGTVQTMRYRRVLSVASLWLPVDDEGAAYAQLLADTQAIDRREESARGDGIRVLRMVTTRD